MKTEKEFDIIASGSDNLDAVYNDFQDFMDEVNTVPMSELKRFTEILRKAKEDGK